MEKTNVKGRKIKYQSLKNDSVLSVTSKNARMYARILEDQKEIKKYEVSKQLDKEIFQQISPVDIRKEYFQTEWTSDFVLYFENEKIAVRELVDKKDLFKRATIEKLEFSRRYWEILKITDWKIVLIGGDE